VAAFFPRVFCKFNLVKNQKNVTIEAREKNKQRFGIHRILEIF
jgi:hypothetical protein